MTKCYFVTGTDTDVGKTVASMAMMQAVTKAGYSVAGYKPVAAGSQETESGMMNVDAIHLRATSTVTLSYNDVNPCLLHAACSPHIAAALEHKTVDFSVLSHGLKSIQAKADFIIVEGAGGWRVPLSDDSTLADWVGIEKLPVIIVVGIKLGCLNHTYLTAEAIHRDGLEIVGWIANRINPTTEYYSEMVKTLEKHLCAPKLGEIPYLIDIKSRDLSGYIDISSFDM